AVLAPSGCVCASPERPAARPADAARPAEPSTTKRRISARQKASLVMRSTNATLERAKGRFYPLRGIAAGPAATHPTTVARRWQEPPCAGEPAALQLGTLPRVSPNEWSRTLVR